MLHMTKRFTHMFQTVFGQLQLPLLTCATAANSNCRSPSAAGGSTAALLLGACCCCCCCFSTSSRSCCRSCEAVVLRDNIRHDACRYPVRGSHLGCENASCLNHGRMSNTAGGGPSACSCTSKGCECGMLWLQPHPLWQCGWPPTCAAPPRHVPPPGRPPAPPAEPPSCAAPPGVLPTAQITPPPAHTTADPGAPVGTRGTAQHVSSTTVLVFAGALGVQATCAS